MSFAWGAGRQAVRLLVTVHSADGATLTTYYPDLTLGEQQMITVPHGATTVILGRPARTRVRLTDHRGGAT